MSNKGNPFVYPEENGFEHVVTEYINDDPYSWYIFGVLKNEKGYYLSTDSGCSCYSPWDYETVQGLTGPLTAAQVHEEVTSLWKTAYETDKVTKETLDSALALVV